MQRRTASCTVKCRSVHFVVNNIGNEEGVPQDLRFEVASKTI